ncbi:uncharacterized protein LOC128955777 [Oppia nitens]|uniref:uncharacterized protein LOC128955777 n=1 Tax=Oppia nitens TaxID=1686743 RepID=UPI0023DC7087|nr:uncharacterized protein LOC128955777 [Oppia nitens]
MTQLVGLSKSQLCNQLIQQLSDMLVVVDHQIQTVRLVSDEKKEISDQFVTLMVKIYNKKQSNNTSTVVEEEKYDQPIHTNEWAIEYRELNVQSRQLTHDMADDFVEYIKHIKSILNIFKKHIKTIEKLEDLVIEWKKIGESDRNEEDVKEKWDELIDSIIKQINELQEVIDKIAKDIENQREFSHMFGDIVVKNT